MKKVFSTLLHIVFVSLIFIFILSSLSTFIPATAFSYIAFFGLGFPYILATYLLILIIKLFIQRKQALLMLIFLPVAYFNILNTFALRTETAWQPKQDSATLRIMTWNVQNFVNNLRKKESASAFKSSRHGMLATIQQYNPDVLCLQEYRNIEHAKKRTPVRKELDSMGYKYYYCSNDRIATLPKNNQAIVTDGVAIYSKFPLLDSGRTNISTIEKTENLIYADILVNNKPVRIFTAHLKSFYIYADTADRYEDENIYEITYKEKNEAEYKMRQTEIMHEAEVTIIRQAIAQSPYPVIYCGDLNITPTSYNYRLLRGDNLQDAFLSKGSGIGNTFYKIGPTLRIDVCLPDKKLTVAQCKRVAIKLSDHYPVITDVKWK